MNDPTRLDDAIDRAVREIMRRDPPAGLRGRVLSRLDEPARRVRVWPMAAAVAALAIVAFVMQRDAPSGPESGARDIARTEAPPAPAPALETPPTRATAAQPRPAPRRTQRSEPIRTATFGPRDGRVSAASLEAGTMAPDQPPAPEPGQPLPAWLPAIVVPPIAAPAPLVIPPLAVAPLNVVRAPRPPEEPR